jgi:hypothetical protein
MTYPRSSNGHVDTGEPIKAANRLRSCPNCGSDRYTETLSREHCAACGLEMDYWGQGGNAVYERHQAREYAREEAADRKRLREEHLAYLDYSCDDSD